MLLGSQCVEWVVKMKGMTESAKAYTFIVIGCRSLGCSLGDPDSAAGVSSYEPPVNAW